MNSLNLRISSVRTGENIKKNSEMRSSIMSLPLKYLKFPQRDFVQKFFEATTIPEQINAVKNIASENADCDTFEFLADMYFCGPLKHPVRHLIAKLLQKVDIATQIKVANALDKVLIDLLNSSSNETSYLALNTITASLSGCFENFPEALLSIKRNIGKVIQFVRQSLQKLIFKLSFQSSPSAKNEIYLSIHNNIRFTLSCVQEFSSNLSDGYQKEMKGFQRLVTEIMENEDMPMDIKSNCGILVAYVARIFNRYETHVKSVAEGAPNKRNNCVALCLCVGVINTVDAATLVKLDKEVGAIINKIVKISNTHATEPCMLLSASRTLFHVTKILILVDVQECKVDMIRMILKNLVQYVFSYLEHHMDSVRHICRDLFRNIIRLESKLKFDDSIDEIFDLCNNKETRNSLKYIVLISISSVIGTEIILQKLPTLYADIFMGQLGNDLNANNCFESLMIANRKEVDFEKWKRTWILPLIEIGSSDMHMQSSVANMIDKAIKCDPEIVKFLVNIENKNIPLSTRFSALWTIRKNGLNSENFEITLTSLSNELEAAMISNNDDTKIMALRLLVETHKTTEQLYDVECEIILRFVKYNSNCQDPAIRQRSLVLISKGLVRLKISFGRALKENNERQMYYRTFLTKLIKMLFGNLFFGASFSRRSVSLQLLKQSVEVVLDCKQPLNEYFPNNYICTLIDTLKDSYEANKALTVSILKLCDPQNISNLVSLEIIRQLMISVRPNDSLSAAYYLEYYCNHTKTLHMFNVNEKPSKHTALFCAIIWSLAILEEGLQIAQNSILLASKTNPLYGSVLTIRHLLSRVEFKELAENWQWRNIIGKLIGICENLTQAVGAVVSSSSPEGHLPNDFSDLPVYLGKGTEQTQGTRCKVLCLKQHTKIEQLKITPQMVLLCAWRTVKEVSLLLGEIVLRSPIKSTRNQNFNYLVTVEQILQIGSHFKELLFETKHRGAFEQTYVGFLKFCIRLWRVEHPELHELPMKWLIELVDLISKDEQINEKICATRRSAGIPFMVQALIISELQVGTTKAFTHCMKLLIGLCSNPDRSTESRTHALNILRTLFRCADLREVVDEYVADGLMVAIRGHTSNTWSERNSSTLLFSAIITRIFGVQRTKDIENLNIRNKMTGRIFFLRYPQLYNFFMYELERAGTAIKRYERSINLHPLLLVLSRLYPSALEGTESNLKLSLFIDIVSVCSGSPEMTTRILSAKAVVAFTTLDVMADRILKILHYIRTNRDSINLNYTHGLLLQLLFMVKACKALNNKFFSILSSDLISLFSILTPNPVIWKTILDVNLEILKRFDSETSSESVKTLSCPEICNSDFSKWYPIFRKALFVYNLYLASYVSSENLFSYFDSYFKTLPSLPNEEIETCLNVLLLILNHETKSEIITTYKCLDVEVDFVDSLSMEKLKFLKNKLSSSKTFKDSLNIICNGRRYYPDCTIKTYVLVSIFPTPIQYLCELLLVTRCDDVKDAIAKCIDKCIAGEKELDKANWKIFLQFLQSSFLPCNSDSLRLTAAKIVRHISKLIFNMVLELAIEDFTQFVNIILCLSRDDDSDVRNVISKTIVILSNRPVDNVCASYASTLFLKHLSKMLRSINNHNLTKAFIQGIVVSQHDVAHNYQNDFEESDIFEPNEANIFAEPYKTLVDCLAIFTECFKDDDDISMFINTMENKYLR